MVVKIVLFVDEKLKKCQKFSGYVLNLNQNEGDTELPLEISKTHGYHRQSFSSFLKL